jgi:hypothetical protein
MRFTQAPATRERSASVMAVADEDTIARCLLTRGTSSVLTSPFHTVTVPRRSVRFRTIRANFGSPLCSV